MVTNSSFAPEHRGRVQQTGGPVDAGPGSERSPAGPCLTGLVPSQHVAVLSGPGRPGAHPRNICNGSRSCVFYIFTLCTPAPPPPAWGFLSRCFFHRQEQHIELQCHSYRGGGVKTVSFSADSLTLLTTGFSDGSVVCLFIK